MDGVHDLGGTQGLGPVALEDNEPVFHAEWEKSVFAMFPAMFLKGYLNLDEFRYGIEQMHPAEYLLSRYYEHWLHTFELYGIRSGVVDPKELDRRTELYLENPDAELPKTADPGMVTTFESAYSTGASARRDGSAPTFQIGDQVRVTTDCPDGHTRKAGYVRGKHGVVEITHGVFILPDSAAMGRGEDPQNVYTVRFRAEDLWGSANADPNSTVTIDLWETYLEKA